MRKSQQLLDAEAVIQEYKPKNLKTILKELEIPIVRIEPGTEYHGLELKFRVDTESSTGFSVFGPERKDGTDWTSDVALGIGWSLKK